MNEKFEIIRKDIGRDGLGEKKKLLIKLNIQIAGLNELIKNEENGNVERLKEERGILIAKRDSLLREEAENNKN